jgi:hypothetical protein
MANGPMYNPFAPVQGQPVQPGPNAFPFSPAFGRNPMAAAQQMPAMPQRPATTNAPLGLLGQATPVQGTYGSLLDDIRNQAGRAGLAQTLMGLGRTTRRGEDRFLGAVQMGQQAQQQAFQQGIQRAAAQSQFAEMDRAERERQRRAEVLANLPGAGKPTVQTAAGQTSPAPVAAAGLFTEYEISQMGDAQQQLAAEASAYQRLADNFIANNLPEDAERYSEIALKKAEQARRGLLSEEKRIDLENTQRTDWEKNQLAPRAQAVQSYNQIAGLAERGAGLSDYANLIAFIKTLDPTSVVREGEVALAGEFQTLQNRLSTIYNKAAEGGFTEEFRRDLVETARKAAEIAARDYSSAVESQLPIIERQSIRPEQVIRVRELSLSPLPTLGGKVPGAADNPASAIKSMKSRGGVNQ